ncbi:hypothetical protein DACRYDRAFT_71462 [Dacryopinax primogenitus]|uniref:Snf7-domain-containing protein n=1 Tax=Dacryopinax primogenitus (strain DJM 731) TaxID=1858805 RepID=M5FWK8_DACPD|nr:uncharacterized protein DACRYDRAFT_71462 [Dacryopinax primogenitus]EJT97801.1 hypothetical protein DACRYDRAFT_71462 [Dacryopinax primogenitus]
MGNAQSGPKITAQDRAVLDLKLQRDKVRQYQKRIQVVLDAEKRVALEALAQGRKDRALIALRRRKYQEQLLGKTDQQLETLEQLVSSVEFSLVQKDVMFGLQQGNTVLKEIHKEMSLEQVEKLMEDTAEAVAYQREIDEMLMSTMTVDEEEAVQRELAQLQAEQLRMPEVPSTVPVVPVTVGKLPEVPTTEPQEPETAREEEEPEGRVALEA